MSPARAVPPRGFTLIEAIIVVAVLGILAAVALPSFLDSIRKGRRSDAMAALTQVQQAQERYRANNASYADHSLLAVKWEDGGLGLSGSSPDSYYTIALSDVSAAGYTATATANSGTSQYADSSCRKLVLRQAGGNVIYSSADAGGTIDTTGAVRCWAR